MGTLRVEGLVTGYDKNEVLHGVDITAEPEGVTCVFGPNGSGKSTLLKAIVGVTPAWRGRITLGDVDLTGLKIHERVRLGIGTVPQNGGVFPEMTVLENLKMGAYVIDDGARAARALDDVFATFPVLYEKRAAKADTLSGGQKMTLAIARSLMTRPRLLLMDEPSAGLSPKLVRETFQLVRRLADEGLPVLLIEQNVRQALRIARHVYILVQGRLQFSGSPAELETRKDLLGLYLGLS